MCMYSWSWLYNRWNRWVLLQGIHLHSWQTSTRNEQMPTRSTLTRMDDQRKYHFDPKRPKQKNRPKQLQTHNPSTDDVDNTNRTNKGRDLLLANKPWIVPWGAERIPQRIQRHSRVTLHKLAHPKRKNLAMAWIDYKKAYDMVPKSWIINCLKMYKILDETINFIEKTMETWRVELTTGERSLAEAKIQMGIFQGNAFSPLQFIIAIMSLNHIVRKCSAGYTLSKSQKNTHQNSKCRLCGDRDETFNHIISECSKLAQKEYKTRHDCVGKLIHWEMCKKFRFDHTNKWYMQLSWRMTHINYYGTLTYKWIT